MITGRFFGNDDAGNDIDQDKAADAAEHGYGGNKPQNVGVNVEMLAQTSENTADFFVRTGSV